MVPVNIYVGLQALLCMPRVTIEDREAEIEIT